MSCLWINGEEMGDLSEVVGWAECLPGSGTVDRRDSEGIEWMDRCLG